MKKLALILALCLLFAGCGAEEKPAGDEQQEMPQGLEAEGTFIGSASIE